MPLEFLFYFILTADFYDLIVVLIAVRELFRKNSIHVQPLHPNWAGALGAAGLFLTISLPQRPPNTALPYNILIGTMFAVYFMMAPIGVYLPLWSAHTAMLSARDSHVHTISHPNSTRCMRA